MPIPVNIEELINLNVVESTRVEFKADFNPNAIVHTICAFANDIDNIGGGYIVVGVEEECGSPKFPVKGIEKSRIDDILKRLVGLCRYIEPLYNPIVEPVLFRGSYVIAIWVPGGYGRPYKATKDVFAKRSDSHYYIRKFSSTIVASPQEEKELFYAASDIPFDDRPNLAASISDLDLGLMRSHLQEIGSALYGQSAGMSVAELAGDMQLLSGPPENEKPRNVGILMFSERPEKYFRYARIEVVDIPDPTGEGMTEQVFTGPIQRQLRDALAYISNYIVKRKTHKLPDAPEAVVSYNYPIPAIEEILSNAVYHRSYQIAEPITVRVTPDKMEITSFPGFDRSITDQDIKDRNIRARMYRNRRIGDFLKELHLIEGRNTGFPTAFAALEKNGSGEPAFEMDENRGFISISIPVHPSFVKEQGGRHEDREFESEILEALRKEPMSLTELARAMGYKGITKKLKTTVDAMVVEEKIAREAVLGSNRTRLVISKE